MTEPKVTVSTNQNAETVMPASWLKRGQVALILRRGDAGKNGAWSKHSTVDYFRFLFAYTGAHVLCTRNLKARRRSMQGMPRKHSGARQEHARAANRGQMSAVP